MPSVKQASIEDENVLLVILNQLVGCANQNRLILSWLYPREMDQILAIKLTPAICYTYFSLCESL